MIPSNPQYVISKFLPSIEKTLAQANPKEAHNTTDQIDQVEERNECKVGL